MPTLTFKVSDEEAWQIRALARQKKLSVSKFLQRQAQPSRQEPREIPRVVCAHTGTTIFGPAPELPALNTESVRGMLPDFP
jgi:hypothetical protein